jgi:flagellar hook protein FlgE
MISIFTGVAGLQTYQRAVDVIANNIANVNTVGFKSARVSFAEALAQTLRAGSEAGTNPMQIGLGVGVASIENLMTQGNLKSTGRPTDVAIVGDGFFVLSDGLSTSFTRGGVFQLDGRNRLVSASNGMRVLGWLADPATGAIDTTTNISPSTEIFIPIGTRLAARQTANVVYQGNLDASQDPAVPVDTSFTIFDSLGAAHQITVSFTKSATTPNEWSWAVTSPDGTSADTGVITFTENGECQDDAISFTLTLTSPNGAAAAIPITASLTTVTQLVGTTSAQAVSQDGLPVGALQSFTIDELGVVAGIYSNGMSERIAQIALAGFTNPAGLSKLGSGLYAPSPNSGNPIIKPARVGSNGTLAAGFLEMSNVDLAQEFANLIVTQRAFQANSRVVTTADEMLQDVLTLKR